MRLFYSIFLVFLMVFTGPPGGVAAPSEKGIPIKSLPSDEWTDDEKLAWRLISQGLPFEPKPEKDAPKTSLSAKFLETILLDSKWADKIPHVGVRVSHVIVSGELNLENSTISHYLALTDCRFDGPIRFSRIHAQHGMSLEGSSTKGPLDIYGAQIGGDLKLDRIKVGEFGPPCRSSGAGEENNPQERAKVLNSGDISLRCARIQGQLSLDGGKVYGIAFFEGIQVCSQVTGQKAYFAGDLRMQGALTQKQVNLEGSKFQKNVLMQGLVAKRRLTLKEACIAGELNMKSAKIDGDVLLSGGCFIGNISLITADITGMCDLKGGCYHGDLKFFGLHVGDQMILDNSVFTGKLQLQRTKVDSTLSLRTTMVHRNISLKGARINGDLFLDGADFQGEFDLHQIDIGGSLIFNKGNFPKPIKIDLARIESVEYKGTQQLARLELNGTTVNKVFVKVQSEAELPLELSVVRLGLCTVL